MDQSRSIILSFFVSAVFIFFTATTATGQLKLHDEDSFEEGGLSVLLYQKKGRLTVPIIGRRLFGGDFQKPELKGEAPSIPIREPFPSA